MLFIVTQWTVFPSIPATCLKEYSETLNMFVCVCSRRQQLVEPDSSPTDQTEEEALPRTLLHGVWLKALMVLVFDPC